MLLLCRWWSIWLVAGCRVAPCSCQKVTLISDGTHAVEKNTSTSSDSPSLLMVCIDHYCVCAVGVHSGLGTKAIERSVEVWGRSSGREEEVTDAGDQQENRDMACEIKLSALRIKKAVSVRGGKLKDWNFKSCVEAVQNSIKKIPSHVEKTISSAQS